MKNMTSQENGPGKAIGPSVEGTQDCEEPPRSDTLNPGVHCFSHVASLVLS